MNRREAITLATILLLVVVLVVIDVTWFERQEKRMFKTTTEIPYSRGFHITFENGWTVSVQWGYGNYCQNRDKTDPQNPETYQSLTAEIAAWNIAGVWHDFGYDTVKGHCDADEVLRWLTHSASLSQ